MKLTIDDDLSDRCKLFKSHNRKISSSQLTKLTFVKTALKYCQKF